MIGVTDRPDASPNHHEQLAVIGVSEIDLLGALANGDAAAARCTSNHPPMAPGFYRFSETVAALAELKAPVGWTRQDHKNFSTIVRPDGLIAIAVASGDGGTGDLDASVSTRSPKGVTTEEAIEVNLKLPYDELAIAANHALVSAVADSEKIQPVTWFLLHDRRAGLRYAELSCPQSIDQKGYVTKWSPRIVLSPTPLDPSLITVTTDQPVNPIVNVKRRSAE